MKKVIFFQLLFIISTTCNSTTWTITNSGFSFSPATLTISPGDDVKFVLGSIHDAREVSQMTWNAGGTTGSGFETPFGGGSVSASQLSAGTHYYVCISHVSSGMKGIIIVQSCAPPSQPPAISGNTSICPNSSNTYSIAAVAGATSYTWSLPSGWSGSSTTTSINTTSSSGGGTITVTANNDCSSSTPRTLTISISGNAQPGNISGNTSICPNSSNTYSIAAVSGATSYTWTLPSGWTGSSTTTSITTTSNSNGGSVSVVANSSCGVSASRVLTVAISNAPTTPASITGNSTICSNSSNTYTITAVAGATSYTWSLPVGWTGSSTTTSITTLANSSGGNISVTANNLCGASVARVLSVTTNSIPAQPANVTGNAAVCTNSSNTYTIVAVAGATSYSWSLPVGWTGSSTTTSITVMSNTTGGSISVTAKNTCGASAARVLNISTISVLPQPASITGNAAVCTNSSNTYTIAAVAGATSYSWSLPVGWTGSSTTTSITVLANSTGGNISVIANNQCGASPARIFSVSTTSAPSQPDSISGKTTLCSNSTNTYTIAAVAGATSYSWSLPVGWTGSSTTTSITVLANSTGGNISVIANNQCGASPARIFSVSTTSAPSQPDSISGKAALCSNSTNTYTIAAVAGATSYSWSLPVGWTGSSTTTSIAALANSTGGNISVIANNQCGVSPSRILSVSTTSAPSQPDSITGNASVCSNSSNTYTVVEVPGATSYTWYLPPGWTGSSTTASITALANSTGGNIFVIANNLCGASSARLLNIAVNSAPSQPDGISGKAAICSNSSNTYSIVDVEGANSYTWTLPPGWTGNSTTDSISVISDTSGGSILVTANNTCGSSIASMLNVANTSAPLQPMGINGNITVCSNSSNTFNVIPAPGASSYTWTLPSGWSGNSTTDSITAISDTSGGNIIVTANNTCGTSIAGILIVNTIHAPSQPMGINGSSSVCINSLNLFNILPVSGASSYTWTLPVGWTGNSNTDSIIVISDTTGGDIIVTANNLCGSSTPVLLNVAHTVKPGTPTSINGNAAVCPNSINTYSIDPVPGASSYTWSFPEGWSGNSNSESIRLKSDTSAGNITVISNNACGSSEANELNIDLLWSLHQPDSIVGDFLICPNSQNTFTILPVHGAIGYTWTLPEGWSGNSSTESITVVSDTLGGTISVTANNAWCPSLETHRSIKIQKVPNQPLRIFGDTITCAYSQNLYSIEPVPGAASYTWSFPAGWSGNLSIDTLSVISPSNSGMITVTANNTCGSSDLRSLNITIDSIDTSVVQSGMVLTSNAVGAEYQWIDCATHTPIPGQTNNQLIAVANGSYAVIVIQNNCADTSSCITISTVGVEETMVSPGISIYPNPSKGVFTLEMDKATEGEIEIYNVLGEIVYRSKMKFPTMRIELNAHPKGIYFATILAGHKTMFTQKLVLN